MAAFSSQYYHPFLLHSTNKKLSSLGDQQPLINTPTTLSNFHNQTSLNTLTNQESTISDIEPSVIKNHSPQTSMVEDKLEIGEQVTQKVTSMQKKRRPKNGPSFTSPLSMVYFLNHFLCFPFLQTVFLIELFSIIGKKKKRLALFILI